MSATNTVAVFGPTGFIASHVVAQLLQGGYSVRAVVRDLARPGAWLKNLDVEEDLKSRISLHLVQNAAGPGALDEAYAGVRAVIHMAKPTNSLKRDGIAEATAETVRFEGEATIEALKSAAKNKELKRFIYTSSVVASLSNIDEDPSSIDRTIAEWTWRVDAAQNAKDVDNGWHLYNASKTLAEELAWDWIKTNKPHYEFVSILPPWTIGRYAWKQTPEKELVSGSSIFLAKHYKRDVTDLKGQPLLQAVAADVRDVAKAHVLAITHLKAPGRRIYTFDQHVTYPAIVRALKKGVPTRKFVDIPDDAECEWKGRSKVETDNVLGIDYHPIEQTIAETGAWFHQSGFFED